MCLHVDAHFKMNYLGITFAESKPKRFLHEIRATLEHIRINLVEWDTPNQGVKPLTICKYGLGERLSERNWERENGLIIRSVKRWESSLSF